MRKRVRSWVYCWFFLVENGGGKEYEPMDDVNHTEFFPIEWVR